MRTNVGSIRLVYWANSLRFLGHVQIAVSRIFRDNGQSYVVVSYHGNAHLVAQAQRAVIFNPAILDHIGMVYNARELDDRSIQYDPVELAATG